MFAPFPHGYRTLLASAPPLTCFRDVDHRYLDGDLIHSATECSKYKARMNALPAYLPSCMKLLPPTVPAYHKPCICHPTVSLTAFYLFCRCFDPVLCTEPSRCGIQHKGLLRRLPRRGSEGVPLPPVLHRDLFCSITCRKFHALLSWEPRGKFINPLPVSLSTQHYADGVSCPPQK